MSSTCCKAPRPARKWGRSHLVHKMVSPWPRARLAGSQRVADKRAARQVPACTPAQCQHSVDDLRAATPALSRPRDGGAPIAHFNAAGEAPADGGLWHTCTVCGLGAPALELQTWPTCSADPPVSGKAPPPHTAPTPCSSGSRCAASPCSPVRRADGCGDLGARLS